MAADKASQQQRKTQQLGNNPLADIAGKLGGKFWLESQSEIKNARKRDKEEISKNLDAESSKSD